MPEPNVPPADARTGRNPDPQGGRVHNVTAKVSIYEAEALVKEKKRMEGVMGKRLADSEFMRLRLLNGGEPLVVDYPDPPVDTRREVRGSVPKTRRRKAAAS